MARIPTDQELAALAERKPAAVGLLAAAALAGGTAVGAGLALSIREGWIEEPELPLKATPDQELLQFGITMGALVLGGDMLRQAIRDMGRDKFLKTMLGYGAALVVFKLVVDGVRKWRGTA